MLRIARLLCLSITAAAQVVALAAAPAVAGGRTRCDDSGCDVTAGTPGSAGSNGADGGGGGGKNLCTYRPADLSAAMTAGLGGQPSGAGAWYVKTCFSPDGNAVLESDLVWLTTPPVVSPEALARQARSRLNLPAPVLKVNPPGTALVNVPVWLALGGGWEQQSATASVPGLSVTATATPQRVEFTMGDGGSVVCTGPGMVYRPGEHDPYSASPDCGYTYRRPSVGMAGEAFGISVTVSWTVAWSGGGQGGTIPGLTTTGSTTLRVGESQAIITR
jgi:hypothetical protein